VEEVTGWCLVLVKEARMPLGQATQDVMYKKPAYEAFEDVVRALNMIGKVQSADRSILFIEGISRSGFRGVQLNVKIIPQGRMSTISISASSSDIRATGAKNCMKRLIEAVANLDNPHYKPSRTGMRPVNIALMVIGFIVLVVAVLAVSASLCGGLSTAVGVLGFGLVVYFIFARTRSD
jgi:hypothetical protein